MYMANDMMYGHAVRMPYIYMARSNRVYIRKRGYPFIGFKYGKIEQAGSPALLGRTMTIRMGIRIAQKEMLPHPCRTVQ